MLLIERVRSSDPASGVYTPTISVPASGRFITLAMTCRGDIYFIPVLKRNRERGNHGETTGSDELEG
ncbi:hypothetical protein SLEP1_g18939 [Rubroshorea leprosula]|uniref:Uncharacterized protein n=1 Tax=Rubroshorea leprosula TaxID=152421 RepID=A0AAV5J836_9ROSI|nr:hypothetical protein SLEP1_g18939 [Rubroshorea leprosula]